MGPVEHKQEPPGKTYCLEAGPKKTNKICQLTIERPRDFCISGFFVSQNFKKIHFFYEKNYFKYYLLYMIIEKSHFFWKHVLFTFCVTVNLKMQKYLNPVNCRILCFFFLQNNFLFVKQYLIGSAGTLILRHLVCPLGLGRPFCQILKLFFFV